MSTDISWLKLPLPEDVERMKAAGFLEDARAAIANYLGGQLPDCMRKRLELELERLSFLPESEYPYDDAAALKLLDETFVDFRPDELPELVNSRAADWIYIKGVRHFHRRFVENILTTRKDYVTRQKNPTPESEASKARQGRIGENRELMKKKGYRAARIVLKNTFQVKPEAVKPGEKLSVQLPIPTAACAHQSDIQILGMSHPEGALTAPLTHPARTICYPSVGTEECWVTYSYVNRLNYVNPDFEKAEPGYPPELAEYLGEQAPHVLFTPFMQELSAEIQKGERNPLKIARNAYNFVTQNVKYSYMREYAALDPICDYAAKNLKGDCGVQAILFITLCRIAGVPARWQSGLAADPDSVGCHDWAQFYVNPYGWLYADPSYGGSGYRAGDLEKWNYYFGNLDIFRMVANQELQGEFAFPKAFFRADPTDNQRGEGEYPSGGLLPFQFTHTHTMLEFEELD